MMIRIVLVKGGCEVRIHPQPSTYEPPARLLGYDRYMYGEFWDPKYWYGVMPWNSAIAVAHMLMTRLMCHHLGEPRKVQVGP